MCPEVREYSSVCRRGGDLGLGARRRPGVLHRGRRHGRRRGRRRSRARPRGRRHDGGHRRGRACDVAGLLRHGDRRVGRRARVDRRSVWTGYTLTDSARGGLDAAGEPRASQGRAAAGADDAFVTGRGLLGRAATSSAGAGADTGDVARTCYSNTNPLQRTLTARPGRGCCSTTHGRCAAAADNAGLGEDPTMPGAITPAGTEWLLEVSDEARRGRGRHPARCSGYGRTTVPVETDHRRVVAEVAAGLVRHRVTRACTTPAGALRGVGQGRRHVQGCRVALLHAVGEEDDPVAGFKGEGLDVEGLAG